VSRVSQDSTSGTPARTRSLGTVDDQDSTAEPASSWNENLSALVGPMTVELEHIPLPVSQSMKLLSLREQEQRGGCVRYRSAIRVASAPPRPFGERGSVRRSPQE
jgi:hypothetical protein